jgi:hypothetical protein
MAHESASWVSVMLYLGLVVLSLVSCVAGWALQIVSANAKHIEYGREPNASVSICPDVPVIPLTYLSVAWGFNWLRPSLGFMIVAAYAVLSIGTRVVQYQRARTAWNALQSVKKTAVP